MKRIVFMIAALSLLLSLPAYAMGSPAEVDGFRGVKWGSPLIEVKKSKKLILVDKDDHNHFIAYTVKGDELKIGAAKVEQILYVFWREKLNSVMISTKWKLNFSEMKAAAFEKFGEVSKTEPADEERYDWDGDQTNIILTYNKISGVG